MQRIVAIALVVLLMMGNLTSGTDASQENEKSDCPLMLSYQIGNSLYCPSVDGTIPIWSSLAFSPDGKVLVGGCSKGTIVVWNTDISFWIDKACQRAGRNLTQMEWEQYFSNEPYRITCPQWSAPENALDTMED